MSDRPDVSICVCTYHRPDLLAHLFDSLLVQNLEFSVEIILTDNDGEGSAAKVASLYAERFRAKGCTFTYCVEPKQGISQARNTGLKRAKGRYVAFIDDDEVADADWLHQLVSAMDKYDADAVCGPVQATVPESFPRWMRESGFLREPLRQNGMLLKTGRSGNALVKRELLELRERPFDPVLGRTGGSDAELFGWLASCRYKIVWAAKAIAHEEIGENRSKVRWHLRRAYRAGWARSYAVAKRIGQRNAMFKTLARLPLSIGKGVISSFKFWRYPYAAILTMLRVVIYNIGEIGFFWGRKVEEYKDVQGEHAS